MPWTVPTNRQGNWTPGDANGVGVPGGIARFFDGSGHPDERPNSGGGFIDVTQAPYNADNTGVSNCASAINSAITACATNGVVYLPAGTYRINSGLSIAASKTMTLRGAGSAQTIIRFYGSGANALTVGSGQQPWSYPGTLITSALSKGDTVIPLSSTAGMSVGYLVGPAASNILDPDDLVLETQGFIGARTPRSRVTNVVSNTSITISPALPFGIAANTARLYRANLVTTKVGLEGFTINAESATGSAGLDIISFKTAWSSWLYDVKVINTRNRHISFSSNVQCEIRKCWFGGRIGDGSNGAGILFDYNCNCWVEDNVITDICALIQMNSGSINNAVTYNYGWNSILFGVPGPAFKDAHSPHQDLNLYEGNVGPNFQSDGRGSSSRGMLFRNWWHGLQPGLSPSWTSSLNRMCRDYTFAGNIIGVPGSTIAGYTFGNPNQGNDSYSGTTTFKGWESTLTTRTSATSGTITALVHSDWVTAPKSVPLPTTHSISSGQKVDVWWVGGERTGVVVGTVVGNSIPISGGTGDDLPSASTDVFVRDWWDHLGPTSQGLAGVLTTRTSDTLCTVTLDYVPADFAVGFWSMSIRWNGGGRTGYRIGNISGSNLVLDNSGAGASTGDILPAEGTAITFWPGFTYGFLEFDFDVEKTTDRVKNYLFSTTPGIRSDEQPTIDLPDSLIHTSTPSWFGSITYPPIDPVAPPTGTGDADLAIIPAGWRFIYGNEDYLGGVGTPQFSPAPSTYLATQEVVITSGTPEAAIRYTTDGSTPTSSIGTLYLSPVLISSTTTLKAIAFNGELEDSAVATGTYTITGEIAATPVLSPSGGAYSGTQSITISTATSGATIRFTTDGSTPSQVNGTVYSTVIGVAATTTVKAVAYKSGFNDSAIASETYTIAPPVSDANAESLVADIIILGD